MSAGGTADELSKVPVVDSRAKRGVPACPSFAGANDGRAGGRCNLNCREL